MSDQTLLAQLNEFSPSSIFLGCHAGNGRSQFSRSKVIAVVVRNHQPVVMDSKIGINTRDLRIQCIDPCGCLSLILSALSSRIDHENRRPPADEGKAHDNNEQRHDPPSIEKRHRQRRNAEQAGHGKADDADPPPNPVIPTHEMNLPRSKH